MTEPVVLRDQTVGAGSTCRRILASLPEWFGLAEANAHYEKVAESHPTTVALIGGEDVGLLTLKRHGPDSAEVYLLAVLPELHRRGVGSLLLSHVEGLLRRESVRYLQVKTLSASKAEPYYEKTRAFYLARGFSVLEEFPTLWGGENPALQLVKAL